MGAELASLAGGLMSTAAQYFMNQEQVREAAQRQSSLLATEQRFAEKMYNLSRNYNDLSSQMQRLKDNGLNPNLVYGNGSVGVLAPDAPSPSAPSVPMAAPVPVAEGLIAAGSVVQAIAQAKKAGAETIGQQLENQYLSQTLQERVKAVAIQNGWTEEQTAKATQEVAYLVGQCNSLQVTIDNLRKDGKLTDKHIAWYDRHMTAEIQNLKSSAEYHNALKGLTDTQKEQMEALFDSVKSLTESQAQMAAKAVELLGRYGDAQAIVGMLTSLVDSATDLLSLKKIFKK